MAHLAAGRQPERQKQSMVERTALHVALMIALVRLKMDILGREDTDPMRSPLIVDVPVDVIFPKAGQCEEGARGVDGARRVHLLGHDRDQGRCGGDKALVLEH